MIGYCWKRPIGVGDISVKTHWSRGYVGKDPQEKLYHWINSTIPQEKAQPLDKLNHWWKSSTIGKNRKKLNHWEFQQNWDDYRKLDIRVKME